jgi:sulfatase maturation enzyme AslB (radical SAM superfamily)
MSLLKKYEYVKKADYESVAGSDWPSFDRFQSHNNIAQFVYDEIDHMLAPDEVFDHPAFCVLPFFGLELNNSETACCLLPPGHDIEKIRSEMLAGQRPAECLKCWRNEDANETSDRQLKNQTLSLVEDTTIQSLLDQCHHGQYSVKMLKIDTSNTCNATCVTCGSMSSSAWAALERKNNIVPENNWRISHDDINHRLDYSNIKMVSFRGGEPFLSSANFDILDEILKHNNPECFVSFVTNGGVDLTDRQKYTLSKFKKVNFCFSIDGIGPVFEYMRYPLSWSKILNNIQWARENDIDVSVSYTLSNVNLWYHAQTIKWFRAQKINFLIGMVEYPTHFQPTALPENIKDRIIDGNPDVAKLLSTHTDQDDQNYQQFLVEIQKQDRWKGISIADYLPEFAEHLPLDR